MQASERELGGYIVVTSQCCQQVLDRLTQRTVRTAGLHEVYTRSVLSPGLLNRLSE